MKFDDDVDGLVDATITPMDSARERCTTKLMKGSTKVRCGYWRNHQDQGIDRCEPEEIVAMHQAAWDQEHEERVKVAATRPADEEWDDAGGRLIAMDPIWQHAGHVAAHAHEAFREHSEDFTNDKLTARYLEAAKVYALLMIAHRLDSGIPGSGRVGL